MDYHHLLEATGIVVSGVLFYSLAYGWFTPDDPLLAQAAAHEINNPLAIIMGYSQLLEERLAAETEEGGWARTCRRAGGRIRDAVGRLNRIVRIESTESTGSLSPILDTERSAGPHDDDARR